MFGGCTELWSNLSSEAEIFAVKETYGAKADYKSAGREPIDYVVSIKEGAWFTPDTVGSDTRGCANVLTADRTSPAGAAPFNSCFVDVAPIT
jgi:anaerobic selenocysteine-containing dehydrogenase